MKEKIERMRREEAKSTLMAMAAFTNHRERERTKREGKTEQKKTHEEPHRFQAPHVVKPVSCELHCHPPPQKNKLCVECSARW
jgi:Tfp pilus assembly protein PilE